MNYTNELLCPITQFLEKEISSEIEVLTYLCPFQFFF